MISNSPIVAGYGTSNSFLLVSYRYMFNFVRV